MTVYAPYPIHSITTSTCRHVGTHKRTSKGELAYDEHGNPYLNAVKSISCSPECESYLLREHGWSTKPVIHKPKGIKKAEAEEAAEAVPPQKALVVVSPNNPTILPLRAR